MTARPCRCCGRCGKERPITANWPDGPVCATCYNQAKWRRGSCPECARERPLPGRRPDGAWVCVDCGKVPLDLICRRCGREAYLHKDHLCQCCELDDRLAELFGDGSGGIPAIIAPIAAGLHTTSIKEAASALVMLRRPVVKDVLTGIAQGRYPLEHTSFDGLGNSRTTQYLRDLFVGHGLLPPRDDELVRFEAWLEAMFAKTEDKEERKVLRTFATWHFLRRFRALGETGPLRRGQALGARQSITVAAQLLAWLRGAGKNLSCLTQADLEEWLSESPGTRWKVGAFVKWATSTRRARRVKMPNRSFGTRPLLSESERHELLGRLLYDETLGLPERIVGALLVVYSYPVTDSVRLTVSDVRLDKEPEIRLGEAFVPMPQPLADLLAAQLTAREHVRGRGRAASAWLFPGGRPGQPLTAANLHQRLQRAGILIRATKNTAVATLVTELPPPVVASTLRLSPATVSRWASTKGASWYLYARRGPAAAATKPTTATLGRSRSL